MKRILAAIGLLSILLWQCNPGLLMEMPDDPPPKPPNCTDSPELQNVTLKDGTVVDVRIIEFGSSGFKPTKFYVPADLLEANFYDPDARRRGLAKGGKFYAPNGLNGFSPDLYKEECPGVVHELIGGPYNGFGLFWFKGDADFGKNVSSKSRIREAGFYEPGLASMYFREQLKEHDFFSSNDYHMAYVPIADSLIAIYNTRPKNEPNLVVGSPEWNKYKSSMLEFAQWLATPPRDRDNDKVFLLGGARE